MFQMHLTKNTQERCVMVRIMRGAKLHQKNFSLKEFGKWKEAEKAAKAWRDKQLEVLPSPEMNAKDRMTSRNHSGVVGVYLARHLMKKRSGREYEYWRWTARWPGCAYRGGISWSITKFGDDDAFALAVICRQSKIVDRQRAREELVKIYGTKKHATKMRLKAL